MLFCSHRAFTTTLLTLGLVLTTTCSKAAAEPPEATYLAERDRWFQQFAQAAEAPDDAQQQALEALTQALLGALAPHPGPTYDLTPRLSLQSLLRTEPGADQLDGLVYSKDAYRLLVTSPYLLRHFLASHPKLPGSIDKLAQDENLYSYAFDWDAGLDRFTEIPLGPQARGTTVYAFAGAWVQDDALVVPDTLAVFVARGNRIYLATHPVTPSLQQISTCEGRWNSYDQKAQASADAAKRAGSTRVYVQANRYWQQGYRAYRQCWKQEARKQAGFAALKQQAREIVRELLKAPG